MRFAHLKVHHRFERMRLRGLTGARDEFHLAAIAQNAWSELPRPVQEFQVREFSSVPTKTGGVGLAWHPRRLRQARRVTDETTKLL